MSKTSRADSATSDAPTATGAADATAAPAGDTPASAQDLAAARKRKAHLLRLRVFQLVLRVLLAIGLGVMLYPAANRLWFAYRSAQQVSEYDRVVSGTDESVLEDEWLMARAYNEARTWNLLHEENRIIDPFSDDAETKALNEEYATLLNPLGNGVMGYIEIPRINQLLNVYHGTDEDSLLRGVGHVQGTSLPVGGEGSHCVLSAHRGLATAKLFTDLDQLKKGDEFYLHVLNHHLAYQVDDIQVVLPDEIGLLDIVAGEDLVTLVTCTPYAVNTHRLLVRGHSIPYVPKESVLTKTLRWLTPERLALIGALLVVVVMIALWLSRRSERQKPQPAGKHAKRS